MPVWNVAEMRKRAGDISINRVPAPSWRNTAYTASNGTASGWAHESVDGEMVFWTVPCNCFIQVGFGTYLPLVNFAAKSLKKHSWVKSEEWGFDWCSFGLEIKHVFRGFDYSIPRLISWLKEVRSSTKKGKWMSSPSDQRFRKFIEYLEGTLDDSVER